MLREIYQPIAKHLLLPLILRRGGESARLQFYREFSKTQYWPSDRLLEMQFERLSVMLLHAYDNCPFYRARFQEYGVNPKDIHCIDDLKLLPPLTKSQIQSSKADLVATNWQKDDLIPDQTGGSTGQPISYYLSKSRIESRAAAAWRHDNWAGLDVGHRVAYVWGAPRDAPSNSWKARLRNRLLGGQIWLDSSNVTDEKMLQFGEQLKKFRPRSIVAYANSIVVLARFLKVQNVTVYQPNSIITSAELLTDAGRKTVEEVFGCPVYNRYGCREFSVVASECEQHDGLHLMSEGLLVEVENEAADHSADGGALLVTDLLNFAMPMIRYRIGDHGSLLAGNCKCGRGLPRLKSVDGRVTDFLIGVDGRMISGVFLATYVVAQRPSLGQVQIVQERAGQVLFKVKPGSNFNQQSDYQYLIETGKEQLGKTAIIDIQLVHKFTQSQSGKTQFSISKALPDYAAVNISQNLVDK